MAWKNHKQTKCLKTIAEDFEFSRDRRKAQGRAAVSLKFIFIKLLNLEAKQRNSPQCKTRLTINGLN